MKYMGLDIDRSKLMTMEYVIDYLQDATYSEMSDLRDRYMEEFGQDLVWNYQDCGDFFPGFYIMPVQEGFLAIPYNSVEADEFEQIIADGIDLLSVKKLQFRLDRYRDYAMGLMSAMEDMIACTEKM